MKRLESMLQRLKVRLLRLDVMLHPLSGLLLSLKAGLRRLHVALLSLFGPLKRFCVGLRGRQRGKKRLHWARKVMQHPKKWNQTGIKALQP
jgi:hypothetical protein